MENKFYCSDCKCSFVRKYLLTQHMKSKKHLKRIENSNELFSCQCGKSYTHKNSLEFHKKTCTYKNSVVEREMEMMRERIDQFEKEREEMKAQISQLLDQQATSRGNTTTTTNSNNTTIDTQNNITIQINSFGQENTEYIDDKAILQCIDRVYKSIPALLQKIHFDPQHPENHNIKITNKKLPYASVMGDNQKWKTMDRKDAIDKMVNNGYYMLDEKYETNKDKFDPRKQQNFECFKDKFETEEKNTMKMVKGDVEMMVINGGEI